MAPSNLIDIGSRFLRMDDGTGYLLVAVDLETGRVLRFDVAPRQERAAWEGFLGTLGAVLPLPPRGFIHPGNPTLEQALDAVFPGVPRQLCTRHFLSSLYQYLRSFEEPGAPPGNAEIRFYRAVVQLLNCSFRDRQEGLYASLISTLEFGSPRLEDTLKWLRERLPLLTAHFFVAGLPRESRTADRILDELIFTLKASSVPLSRPSAIEIARRHIPEIESAVRAVAPAVEVQRGFVARI